MMRLPALVSITLFLAGFAALVSLERGGALREADALAPAAVAADLDDFMLVVHGPKGLKTQIEESLKGSGPADEKAWKAVKARAAVIAYLTDTILSKAQPSKGDKAAWKTKVTEYGTMAKALAKATADKDSDAAKAELGKMGKSCEGCHKAHR